MFLEKKNLGNLFSYEQNFRWKNERKGVIKSCSRTVDLEKEQFPDFEKQKEEMNLKMEEINNILNEALQVIFFFP